MEFIHLYLINYLLLMNTPERPIVTDHSACHCFQLQAHDMHWNWEMLKNITMSQIPKCNIIYSPFSKLEGVEMFQSENTETVFHLHGLPQLRKMLGSPLYSRIWPTAGCHF